MATPPRPNVPDVVGRLLADVPLDRSIEDGLPALARLVGTDLLALFITDGMELTREFWHPADDPRHEANRLMFRGTALEAVARTSDASPGATADSPDDPPPVSEDGTRGHLVLEAASRPRGVLVWSRPESQRERAPDHSAELMGVFYILALKVAMDQETANTDALRTQYERWFRTLDEQLRVLDRERQKFAAIVHRFDAGVFVTDTARRIRWTNSVMSSQQPPGPEGSSWIGQGCQAVCGGYGASDGRSECDDCPLSEALGRNEVAHREYRRGEPGEERNHYLSALPIKGPDGLPYEVMVMIQDLSDLEILRKSESRYRLLFERSARAILMVNPDTREILMANPMATQMTGYSHASLLQRRIEDLHGDAEWERVSLTYERAFERGSLADIECRVLTHSGGERQAIVSGTRYELGSQEVVMLEFEDVTESRRVRKALSEAERQLQSVVSHSPIVLFNIDRNGIFTLSEGKGLESLGLEPGQAVGQSAYELYRENPKVLTSIHRALNGEEFAEVIDVGGLTFETRYTPTRDAEGNVDGVIGVATDVSDQHRLEEQLRHAQRMEAIGRLAGGVAHDFNNLLAAILGHGELMMSELEPGHPLRRNAEEIQKAGVRGALLTRQLLAFSRKEVLAPAVFDLNAIVLAMDEMLRRLIGEDIELVSVPGTRPASVKADRGQLEQIIMNLALNARDAMPKGGRLQIEVDRVVLDEAYAKQHPRVRPGEYCVLAVSDSGCGMDAETMQHVFEPFYTTKEMGKGTGLGLATVYGIAERSGGHVWVFSEPGVGTTFKVYLPASSSAAIAADALPAPAVALRGAETVLLVEDEDTVRSVAREVLEANGYHVIEACHGVEALRAAAAHNGPIHLLVSDVVMPHMGGGELAEKLTSMLPGVRVLFISGYTDDSVVRHGVRERGTAFLQKPFSLETFANKVRDVLDAPQDLTLPSES